MRKERFDILKLLIQDITVNLESGEIVGRDINWVNRNGYKQVHFGRAGKKYKFYLHEVIATAGGMDLVSKTVEHKDGNKLNNAFKNFESISTGDNTRSYLNRKETGLNADKVREIRRLVGEGVSQAETARLIGTTGSTVNHIIKGRKWSWVD